MVYHLSTLQCNIHFRAKTCVSEYTSVPSATSLYPRAGWAESKTWDMSGVVFFSNHPELRRILTD